MEHVLTLEEFHGVAREVIALPQMRDDLASNNLLDRAHQYLSDHMKEIVAPLSEIDLEYDRLLTTAAEAKARAQRSIPGWRHALTGWESESLVGFGCMTMMALGLFSVIGAALGLRAISDAGDEKYFIIVSIGVAVGVLLAMFRKTSKTMLSRAEAREGTPNLKAQLEQTRKKAREPLGNAIANALRSLINSVMSIEENYALALPQVRFDGLAERMDAKLYVNTRTKAELHNQMARMPCGTIGIAGPRGVGKTTLLKAITDEVIATTADRVRKPELSVFTAVPVEYQGRDFILHLFANVCRAVLDDSVRQRVLPQSVITEHQRPLKDLMREVQAAALSRTWEAVQPIAGASLAIGIVFLLLSTLGTPAPAVPTGTSSAKASAPPAGGTSAQRTEDKKATLPGATVQGETEVKTTIEPSIADIIQSGMDAYFRVAIKPDVFLLWGIVFLFLGATGVLKVHGKWLPFLLRPWRRHQAGNGNALTSPGESNASQLSPKMWEQLLSLSRSAQQALLEIKYQRSYTSGWAGALKLPVALETSTNAASTLAETQRSLPEIVEAYRQFVNSATAYYGRVVIAIDELDKLESQEVVFRFMNEIKGLFGIDSCFYLISVSDAAISDFERRGMNFSNVFDSALDTMVQASYFRRKECRDLINKRTVGLPQSFLAVLEVVSAGLPRDLVRAARDLDRESTLLRTSGGSNPQLSAVVSAMTRSDASAKLFAMITTVKTIKAGPATSDFLEIIQQLQLALESSPPTSDLLLDTCRKLCERLRKDSVAVPAEINEERDRLESRVQELAAYLYLTATVVDIFDAKLTDEQLRAHDSGGAVRQLVRARQDLRLHPGIAFTRATSLRGTLGLPTVQNYWNAPALEEESDG